ncbi:hypothetical protein LLG96_04200 [bacterium]|nr:hypothetical protein [bacterium]
MNTIQQRKNTEATIERIKTSFSSVYLTLISVIQAGVLGYFIFLLDKQIGNIVFKDIIPLITTFIMIVTTWNEYMMGSTVLRWIPSLKDSFIPFLLGISELFVIRSVFSPAFFWFYSLGVFCLFGYIAFLNMFYSARKHPENVDVFAVLGCLPLLAEAWTLGGAAIFFCLGFLLGQRSSCIISYYMSVLGAFLFFSGFLIRGVVYWKRITLMPADNTVLPVDPATPGD